MFYYLKLILFFVSVKGLTRTFKSGSSPRRNRVLAARSKKVGKKLVNYILNLQDALEAPIVRLSPEKIGEAFISRLSENTRRQVEKDYCPPIFFEDEKFDGEELFSSPSLIFFDIDGDCISLNPSADAENKLMSNFSSEFDYGNHQSK